MSDPVNVRRAPDGSLYTVPVTFDSQQRLQASLEAAAHNSDQLTVGQGGVMKAAGITLALGQIRAAVPGVGGVAFSALLSGTGVTTGHVPVFGPALSGNFLPAPIGYLPESATTVPHNYYLPRGSSNFIPELADQLDKGFGLQRAEDAAAQQAARASDATARAARLDALVKQLPQGARADLAAGKPLGSLTELGQQVNAFSLGEQQAAAQRVGAAAPRPLFTPAAAYPVIGIPAMASTGPSATQLLSELRAANQQTTLALIDAARRLDEEEARINPFLRVGGGAPVAGEIFGAPVPSASILPENIQPVNDAAKRNQDGATGIRKILVSERADP